MNAAKTRIRSKRCFAKGGGGVEKNKFETLEPDLTKEQLRERLEALKDEKFILTVSLQKGGDDDDKKV